MKNNTLLLAGAAVAAIYIFRKQLGIGQISTGYNLPDYKYQKTKANLMYNLGVLIREAEVSSREALENRDFKHLEYTKGMRFAIAMLFDKKTQEKAVNLTYK